MGPGIDSNNTAEKEKKFLACIDNVYLERGSNNKVLLIIKN